MKLVKRYWKFLLMVALIAFAAVALGDTGPSPVPVGAPGSLNWTVLLAAIPALAVAVLDFIFAVNPNSRSNGFLHWVYLALGGKDTPPAVK